MSEKLTRMLVSDGGMEYSLALDVDRFGEPNERSITRGKHDRRYNIKIRQEDVALLDALVALNEVPRSLLLNNLLHDILLNALQDIKDNDVRLLLAHTADQRAHYDELSCPWVFDAIETECRQIMQNIFQYNQAAVQVQDDPNAPSDHSWNSEDFLAVKEALEGLDK
ncbi:hypothetical protein NOV72_01564 [Caballeronia novacaledonica]|uniref:Uncharacterized protein n=1 Tax=Caballeronia novacaledonica TaxID=1544861 RepID=A0A2U3I2G7_9BURK|nr:hypothetical protein [Caballeronia novacaledonica]SPB14314.1 hypothetical protein NOV72_01564 [Caballeronia novacaledonica]